MYSLNLALLWCEHAWPTNMDDADMAQNRVFNNAMEKQVDIRVRNVEMPRARKAKVRGSFSLSFPDELRSGVAETNCTEAQFWTQLFRCFHSSPGSSIYVILLFNHRNEELNPRYCRRISEVDTPYNIN